MTDNNRPPTLSELGIEATDDYKIYSAVERRLWAEPLTEVQQALVAELVAASSRLEHAAAERLVARLAAHFRPNGFEQLILIVWEHLGQVLDDPCACPAVADPR